MIAGGLDPLHLHTISYLLPALNGLFSPISLTSSGLKYISTRTFTIKGGWSLLFLTSQVYTLSKWALVSLSILSTLWDFRLSGKYWVSSVTNSLSRCQDTLANGFPSEAMQVKVMLAPSAYAAVVDDFNGPFSSKTCTPLGGTVKKKIISYAWTKLSIN